ncbi:MAG: hypothetical protein ACO1TE_13795 [Prosthecobacter sp.]
MEHLARGYWRPLYVFARHRNFTHEEAADAVQGFFENLLTREALRSIERRDARFRTWLLACFKNWLGHVRRQQRAARRGAGAEVVPLDEIQEMEFQAASLASADEPEKMFDQRWARAVYDRALQRLDADIAGMQRRPYFEALRRQVFDTGGTAMGWEAFAEQHGVEAGTARKAAHDLRQRFAGLLRAEVRSIVGGEGEVDGELRYLASLLIDSP